MTEIYVYTYCIFYVYILNNHMSIYIISMSIYGQNICLYIQILTTKEMCIYKVIKV